MSAVVDSHNQSDAEAARVYYAQARIELENHRDELLDDFVSSGDPEERARIGNELRQNRAEIRGVTDKLLTTLEVQQQEGQLAPEAQEAYRQLQAQHNDDGGLTDLAQSISVRGRGRRTVTSAVESSPSSSRTSTVSTHSETSFHRIA